MEGRLIIFAFLSISFSRFNVLLISFLVFLFSDLAGEVDLYHPISKPTIIYTKGRCPDSFWFRFSTFRFLINAKLRRGITALCPFHSKDVQEDNRVRNRSVIITRRLSGPEPTIGASERFTNFFRLDIRPPLFMFICRPFNDVLVHVQPSKTSTGTIDRCVRLIYNLVVLISSFGGPLGSNFLDRRELCPW